jgi:hypothetical protein
MMPKLEGKAAPPASSGARLAGAGGLVYDRGRMTPGLSHHLLSRPLVALAATGLLCWVGCTNESTPTVSVTHPTMIEISPDTFLGEVPCTEQPGGLTRYVATLTDVTARLEAAGGNGAGGADDGAAGEADFALPSSTPVPCLSGVGFGFVVPGRKYEALIEGYDTDQVVPRAQGSRLMVQMEPVDDVTTPEALQAIATAPALSPRWSASCRATTAVSRTVLQASCDEFVAAEGGTSDLRIDVSQLLGDLQCGDEPGQVARLNVSLDVGEDAARELEIPCDGATDAIFSDVPARKTVSAYVAAFGADDNQLAGAKCEALTLPSASVTASCARLSQLGTLRVELPEALAAVGLTCNAATLSDVLVDVPGEDRARSFPPPDCLQPFDHGFGVGAAAVTVTVLNVDQELATLTCGGEIIPGSLVVANCVQNQAQ